MRRLNAQISSSRANSAIAAHIRKLERVLFPTEIFQRSLRALQKFLKAGALRKKRQPAQSFSDGHVAFICALTTKRAQQIEIVEKDLVVGFAKNVLKARATDGR